MLAERRGELAAPVEPVRRVLRECFEEHVVEVGQVWAVVAESGRRRMQVLPDHRDGIGVLVWRHTGKQVECRGGQRVLVGAAINIRPDELLGGSVGNGAHRDVGLGDSADVGELTGNTEVRQQDSAIIIVGVGQQDVGGLDVTMQ